MAVVSSHVLDAVSGIHASDVRVQCLRVAEDGARQSIFDIRSGHDGRINMTVDVDSGAGEPSYELVFHTGDYFRRQQNSNEESQFVRCVVVRLAMPDPDARYHVPVIVSPHSHTVWWGV